jgi:hypothetical protein
MKFSTYISTGGAILALVGSVLLPYLHSEALPAPKFGYQFIWGQIVVGLSILVLINRILPYIYKRYRFIQFFELVIAGFAVLELFTTYFSSSSVLKVDPKYAVIMGDGYLVSVIGFLAVLSNAIVEFIRWDRIPPNATFLKIALYWRWEKIREQLFLERRPLYVGPGTNNDIVLPAEELAERAGPLFQVDREGTYRVPLTQKQQGTVNIRKVKCQITDFVKDHTSNVSGENWVPLRLGDWGVLAFDNLGLFFELVRPDSRMPPKKSFGIERRMLTAFLLACVLIFTFLFLTILLWKDEVKFEPFKEKRKLLKVDVKIAEEKEEDIMKKAEERTETKTTTFGNPAEDLKETQKPLTSKLSPEQRREAMKQLAMNTGIVSILKGQSPLLNQLLQPTLPQNMLAVVVGDGSGAALDPFGGTLDSSARNWASVFGGRGNNPFAPESALEGVLDKSAMGDLKNPKLNERNVAIYAGKAELIEGELDRETIRRYIAMRMAQIRFCYQQAVQQYPDLAGQITVSWIIDTTGKVINPSIKSSSLNNEMVEKCIISRIGTWEFPAPKSGVARVNYPFIFKITK